MFRELHFVTRGSWLRAAVLGANDGLVSTAALMLGVAAATNTRSAVLVAGFAALAAGAMSMAIGEYSSVSSQRDSELADLERERKELDEMPAAEVAELTAIYQRRGLPHQLARQVAVELTNHDALGAHARDELGLDPNNLARPGQASAVSAFSFSSGALLPVLITLVTPKGARVPLIVAVTLVALGVLGAVGAHLGGAPKGRAAVRVLVGGGLAMLVSAAVGHLAGTAVG
jgi:vacuolar iron transporter family protein